MSDTKKSGTKIPKLEGEHFVLLGATIGFALAVACCEGEEGIEDSLYCSNGELITTDSYLALSYKNAGNEVLSIAG
jgi:hypothetical protein